MVSKIVEDKAKELRAKLADEKMRQADIHHYIAFVYFQAKYYTQAAEEAKRGFDLDNTHRHCFFRYAMSLRYSQEARGENKIKEVDDKIKKATEDFKKAIDGLDKSNKEVGKSNAALHILETDKFRREAKYDNAEKELDRAEKLITDKVEIGKKEPVIGCEFFHITKAFLDLDRMNFFDALNHFKDAVAVYKHNQKEKDQPEFPWIFPNLHIAEIHTKRREYGKAREVYEQILKDHGDLYPDVHKGLGDLARAEDEKHSMEDIKELYKKAKKINPDWGMSYYSLGEVCRDEKKYEEAKERFTEAKEHFKAQNFNFYESLADNELNEIELIINAEKEREGSTEPIYQIIEKTKSMSKDMIKAQEKFEEFYWHTYPKKDGGFFTLEVLKRWASFTPILSGDTRVGKDTRIGGGFFIKYKGKGIVIDPGFNFLENFIDEGYKFKEIDYVMISHAHNDHTADLDSILVMLHKYNEALIKDIVKHVKKRNNIEHKSKDIYDREVKKQADEIYKEKRKVIEFYVSDGVLQKYEEIFKKAGDACKCRKVEVDELPELILPDPDLKDLKIHNFPAKHDDVFTKDKALGFCFELTDFALVYTGDTSFSREDGDISDIYSELKTKLGDKKILLLANIGGFKPQEEKYAESDKNNKDFYYKNHLGRLGVARLVEILQPEVCVLTEFGEEFLGHRRRLSDIFQDAFENAEFETKFIPSDVGLKIRSNFKVCISKCKDTKKGTCCVDPENLLVIECSGCSNLSYEAR